MGLGGFENRFWSRSRSAGHVGALTRSRVAGVVIAIAINVPASGSWRFDGGGSAALDYGVRALVPPAPDGAFSCFVTVRRLSPGTNDAFLIGEMTPLGGWKLIVDHDVHGTGAMDRVAFHVSDALGATTERYASTPLTTGEWVAIGGSYAWSESDGTPAAMMLYVDGNDVAAPPLHDAGASPAAPAGTFAIGGHPALATGAVSGRMGHTAVWNGVALTPDDHARLAAGADPRTIQPDALVFYARLEDDRAIDTIADVPPIVGAGAEFDTDRWPESRPLIVGLGDVTPTSIKVLSHVGRSASHVIEYSADTSYALSSAVVASNVASDYVVVHELTGLLPDTEYHYRVRVDGAIVRDGASTFRTAPAGASAFRFIFSSCTEFDHQSLSAGFARYSHATFNGVIDRQPLFTVHAGDVWYSDSGGTDALTPFNAWTMNTTEAFNRKAMQILAARDVAAVHRRVPMYMMPDDHEFTNNVDASHRSSDPASPWQRALDRVMHWQFAKNPARRPVAVAQDGLWYSFSIGDVDFFFLDMRTQRGFNGAPGAGTMLGNTPGMHDGQLGDLLDWIDTSTASFKVILAGSLLSDRSTTWMDSWQAAFPQDQQLVIDALRRRRDVVYLAGDVHWSGAIRIGASPTGDPAHDFYEFVGGTYGGHLSTPTSSAPADVLMVYDGRAVTPNRYSYLEIDVDTSALPAVMNVRIISHDPCDGTETVEYAHPPIVSEGGCQADFDRDGAVTFADILTLIGAWGPCSACEADLDDSGAIGFGDVLELIARWGPC